MERKFSIIIPTMKRCWPITVRLLETLYNDSAVGEIILIDNSEQFEPYDLPFGNNKWIDKIKPVQMDKNMYVNPSWNWGVSKAKHDYVCLCNDDILLPENIMSIISEGPLDDLGIIGAFEPVVQSIDNMEPYHVNRIDFRPSDTRWNAFGIFMVLAKKNYIPIPAELKVWCGDDFLYHTNRIKGKQNGMLVFPIKTQMSATSDSPEFDEIKAHDQVVYEEVKKQYGI